MYHSDRLLHNLLIRQISNHTATQSACVFVFSLPAVVIAELGECTCGCLSTRLLQVNVALTTLTTLNIANYFRMDPSLLRTLGSEVRSSSALW